MSSFKILLNKPSPKTFLLRKIHHNQKLISLRLNQDFHVTINVLEIKTHSLLKDKMYYGAFSKQRLPFMYIKYIKNYKIKH